MSKLIIIRALKSLIQPKELKRKLQDYWDNTKILFSKEPRKKAIKLKSKRTFNRIKEDWKVRNKTL